MSDSSKKVLFNPFDVVEDASTISLSELPSELQRPVKMLLKKDLLSRLKGFNLLNEWLEKDATEETFTIFRKQFITIYTTNVMDPERQIRELAHTCLVTVLKTNKKWLSPSIKSLFYPLFGGLLDPVPSVATVANRAFLNGFGATKKAEACKVAATIVLEEAWEMIRIKEVKKISDQEILSIRSFEVCHSLNAANFVASNLTATDLTLLQNDPILYNIVEQSAKIFTEFKDSSVRSALYRLISTLYQRKLLLNSDHVNGILDQILRDLSSSIASSAISVLATFESDTLKDGKCLSALQSALSYDMPKSCILSVGPSLFLNGRPEELKLAISNVIWDAIIGYKSLDSLRLLEIWKLYCSVIVTLETEEERSSFFDKGITWLLGQGSRLEDEIIAEMFQHVQKVDPIRFSTAFQNYLSDSNQSSETKTRFSLFAPDSVDLSTIIDDNLLKSWYDDINGTTTNACEDIVQIALLKLDTSFVAKKFLQIHLEARDPSELADFLSGLTLSSPKLNTVSNIIIESLDDIPDQSSKLTILAELAYLHPTIVRDNLSTFSKHWLLIDLDSSLLAKPKNLLLTENILRVISGNSYFDKSPTIEYHDNTIPEWMNDLLKISMIAIRDNDEIAAKTFFLFKSILSNEKGEEIIKAATQLDLNHCLEPAFRLSNVDRYRVLEFILEQQPDLCKGSFKELSLLDSSFFKMAEKHLETSVALYSIPLLMPQYPHKANWDRFDDDIFSMTRLASLILSASIKVNRDEMTEKILILLALQICLDFEIRYYLPEQRLPNPWPLRAQCLKEAKMSNWRNLLVTMAQEKRGFYVVLAQRLELFNELDNDVTKMSLYQAALVDPGKVSLPSEISLESAIFYMAIEGVSWSRSDIFQLLAAIEGYRYEDDDGCLQHFSKELSNIVITRFIEKVICKGEIKDEYWLNNLMIVSSIVDLLIKKASKTRQDMIADNVLITSSLKVAQFSLKYPTIRTLIETNMVPFWNAFKFLSTDQSSYDYESECYCCQCFYECACYCCCRSNPIMNSMGSDFGKLILAVGKSLAIQPEEICMFVFKMFKTVHIQARFTCRSLLLFHLDDCLELAKVELGKLARDTMDEVERYEKERESFLLPWNPLKTMILKKTESSLTAIDMLFALDLFLCFAEGSKEEPILSEAYSIFFKEHISSRFLWPLVELLGWCKDDDPIDLSKIEFTIIDFEDERAEEGLLVRYAANLLFRCMKLFPSTVRQWSGLLGPHDSVKFTKNCTLFVAPLLIQRELQRVRQGSNDQLKMKVEQTSTNCMINVQYTMEEFSFSIQLTIPPEYPLKPITMVGGERLGISESKWRSWLLSVRTLLNQNLSVADVMRQWKINVEKTLAGIEPCSICYCVLQPGDRSLPGPSCKTCHNKFHSACLYRWFKTGSQATCPMCRALF